MPGKDRTGPEGEGPMTGWGAGDCAGQPTWGPARPMRGRRSVGRRVGGQRGLRGRSGGWRRRHWFNSTGRPRWARFGPASAWAPPAPEQETEDLKAQAKWLTGELDAINQRLGELEDTN